MTPADALAGGWAPDKETVEHANLTRFLTWLADTGRGEFAYYHQLWSESVRDVEWFWDAVWHFFGIRASTLADKVLGRVTAAIRAGASPRHVPDDIVAVPGIPRTMTGKRLEIPIKRILLGAKPADVVSSSAVDRPDLLDVFAEHART